MPASRNMPPHHRVTQEPVSPERRRHSVDDNLPAAPKQLHRGASPEFMGWILKELARRDKNVDTGTISTHDLTMGATWDPKLHKKKGSYTYGYGYGQPTSEACIRALTMEAETIKLYTGKGASVYEFITGCSRLTWRNAGQCQPQGKAEITSKRLSEALLGRTEFTFFGVAALVDDSEIVVHVNHFVKSGESYYLPEICWKHAAAQPLRDKLAKDFGDDWQKKCFGTSTHFLSHAWDCSFAGLIEATNGMPPWAFLWCDIITINQHAAAKERAADLDSLQEVIKHTGRVHLYYEPLARVKAIKRLWVLFELATNDDFCGELSLGFSKKGQDGLMKIAEDLATVRVQVAGFGQGTSSDGERDLDTALYNVNSSRAEARVKEDEKRIKAFIKQREGSFKAFDKQITNLLTNVVDATKWAVRCKDCKKKARGRRHTLKPLPLTVPLVVATTRGTCLPYRPHRRASRACSRRHFRPSSRARMLSTFCASWLAPAWPAPPPPRLPSYHRRYPCHYQHKPAPQPLAHDRQPLPFNPFPGVRWRRPRGPSCCSRHSRKPCRASLARRRKGWQVIIRI